MNGEDPKISNLKTTASTNNPKILYNALSNLPRSDRYRCLYTLDGQGMDLLEWAIHNDYWNSAHLLVYYAWVGNNFQLRNYSDLDPCRVPSLYWNQILAHTISLFHNTKQIRYPKISNDELPEELRQRLSICKKAQKQGCYDLGSSLEDELVFMLVVRLGTDVTRKNSRFREWTEREFPIDQLPAEMLVVTAQYLRADDILALLLTTKSLSKILFDGSALWQQHFLRKQLRFKPDDRCREWKSKLASQARTCIKWRTGHLVEKRDFKVGPRVHTMHKQWALIEENNILKARHWDDEASPLFCGQTGQTVTGRPLCRGLNARLVDCTSADWQPAQG